MTVPTKPTTPTPTQAAFAKLPRIVPGESKRTVLLQGPPGSAKTEGALSFPEPIVMIHTDRNFDTLNRAIGRGVKVDPIPVAGWQDYAKVIVPAIANRELDCETIVVDTVSALTDMMWRDIQGTSAKLTIQDFGTGLNRLVDTTFQLTSAAHATSGRRSYNIVFTTHLKSTESESGGAARFEPAIMGRFCSMIANFFDYALLLEAFVDTRVAMVDNKNTTIKTRRFKVYSVPPSPLYFCKGGVLPPELIVDNNVGLWSVLNQHWSPADEVGNVTDPKQPTQE